MQKLLFLMSLLFCLSSSPAFAAEKMKIVYFDSYPPRSWQQDGKMTGILVDIIDEALQQRLGIPLQHEGYPWARAQALVETGLADAFITVPTKTRRAYTEVSSEPVIQFNLYIATGKNNPKLPLLQKVNTIEELKPFRIVDYFGNGFAKKRLQGFDVEWLPNIDTIYPFLAAGKADLMLISDGGVYNMEKLGYRDQFIVLPQVLHSLSFHLCVGKQSPFTRILPDADKVLREMRLEGRLDLISRSYYQESQAILSE